jgi:hypothetical protein
MMDFSVYVPSVARKYIIHMMARLLDRKGEIMNVIIDVTEIDPLWNLSDTFTVKDAAELIAGYDPEKLLFIDNIDPEKNEAERRVNVVFSAISGAINACKLKATIRHDAHPQGWDEYPNINEKIRADSSIAVKNVGFMPAVIYRKEPNWRKTTVDRADIVAQ